MIIFQPKTPLSKILSSCACACKTYWPRLDLHWQIAMEWIPLLSHFMAVLPSRPSSHLLLLTFVPWNGLLKVLMNFKDQINWVVDFFGISKWRICDNQQERERERERERVCLKERERERESVWKRERERVGVPTRYIVLPLINNIWWLRLILSSVPHSLTHPPTISSLLLSSA